MTLTLTLPETLPGWTWVRVSSFVSIGPAVWPAIRNKQTDRQTYRLLLCRWYVCVLMYMYYWKIEYHKPAVFHNSLLLFTPARNGQMSAPSRLPGLVCVYSLHKVATWQWRQQNWPDCSSCNHNAKSFSCKSPSHTHKQYRQPLLSPVELAS